MYMLHILTCGGLRCNSISKGTILTVEDKEGKTKITQQLYHVIVCIPTVFGTQTNIWSNVLCYRRYRRKTQRTVCKGERKTTNDY